MGLQPCLQALAPWATHCGERSCCLLASPVNDNHLRFQLTDRSPILIAYLRPRCYGSSADGVRVNAEQRLCEETLALLACIHGEGTRRHR